MRVKWANLSLWVVVVRDAIMGVLPVDFDIEVQGCKDFTLLQKILQKKFKNVCLVGKSFGVLKVGLDVEICVPRADSKVGLGHKGFDICFLPESATFAEASRRRDLTVNAIGYDPFAHEIYDPYGGVQDINTKTLHCVDVHTFGEDPLRPWRAMQFMARFSFDVTPDLLRVCQDVEMHISKERIFHEVRKWLQCGSDVGRGWTFLCQASCIVSVLSGLRKRMSRFKEKYNVVWIS